MSDNLKRDLISQSQQEVINARDDAETLAICRAANLSDDAAPIAVEYFGAVCRREAEANNGHSPTYAAYLRGEENPELWAPVRKRLGEELGKVFRKVTTIPQGAGVPPDWDGEAAAQMSDRSWEAEKRRILKWQAKNRRD
jgi:hypothetical protein